ncbi:hypothetical protein VTO42DRAFT_4032 [Malbranchea cinnamomea]
MSHQFSATSLDPFSTPSYSPTSAVPAAPPPAFIVQSCLSSPLGALPASDSGLRVEPKGLYALLWYTGYTAKYHWALLLARTSTTGILFHQTTTFGAAISALRNFGSTTSKKALGGNEAHVSASSASQEVESWRFITELEDVSRSPGLLCALKIGALDDDNEDAESLSDEWIAAVRECVRSAEVEDGEQFSCRTWLLAAIYELANGGFISMVPDRARIARTVEREARALARDAEILGTRLVSLSEMV